VSLAEWFGRGLATAPGGQAVRDGATSLTYEELHERALQVAGAVSGVARRARPVVGILADRGAESYTLLLGATYAGAVAVPLHPSFPARRILDTAQAAGVEVLLVDPARAARAAEIADRLPGTVVLTTDLATGRRTHGASGPVLVSGDDVAYLLFTSGSTGRPKGVPVRHASVDHFLTVNHDRYGLTPDDTCSQTFDLTFDLAMFDLFMAWGAGATVVTTPTQALWALPDHVARERLTVWFSVPSAITVAQYRRGLPPGSLPSLRWSLFCGEALRYERAAAWQAAAPRSIVENLYGPTELTIACSVHRFSGRAALDEGPGGIVPIGELYPGMSALLLGEDGATPHPDEGELCVTGPQMFRGYLDRADDAGRFHQAEGRRWYRTGDRVRRAGTQLCYLGRTDHQVKIRGFRVELGEIEQQLVGVPGIGEAVVVVAGAEPGEARLTAWFTGDANARESARRRLVATLPEYAVPHAIRHLDTMPLTPNGKVDRRALAERAAAPPSILPASPSRRR
jgi:amino acid adenylation domain-containing protein